MENQENATQVFTQGEATTVEPRQTGLATVFFRTIAGLFGGAVGSIIMFVIIMLTQATLQDVFSGEFNPVYIFVVLAMAFLGSMMASLSAVSLISYAQQNKYLRLTSSLVQVFVLNLLTFIVLVPAYIITIINDADLLVYVAGIHLFISVMGSAFIMEILADFRYAILSIYSVSTGLLLSAFVMFFILMYSHTIGNATMNDSPVPMLPLLTALPICWTAIGFFVGVGEMIYRWIYETYGKDYFSTDTKYGVEYDKANADDADYDEQEEGVTQIFDED